MSTNIITVEDMNYLAQQSSGNLNMILSGMTALMNDNDSKVEMLENQTWFQRMSNTISGKNKMTQQEIQQNHDRINIYMSQAMTELFNQNCIDHQIMMSLGNQINELYADHIQLKQMLGAFVSKLNEKIESIDNFHILNTEIEQGVYSNEFPIVSICMVLSQIDSRTIKDDRKLDILKRSMIATGIISDVSFGLKEVFLELLNISMDNIGKVYLELETLRDNFLAGIFISVMENYYFLPDLARKMKNKNLVVESVMSQNQLDDSISVNILEIYDEFIRAKKNKNYVIEVEEAEYNEELEIAERAVLKFHIEEALEKLEPLVKENNVRAIYLAGLCYIWGYPFDDNNDEYYETGKDLLVKGYEENYPLAAMRYALLLRDKKENECIFSKYILELENMAKAGDPFTEYEYGIALKRFGDNENWIEWIKKSSGHGFCWATFKLGDYFKDGIGTKCDEEMAFSFYEKAYKESGAMLQQVILPLADCYYDGIGVDEDLKKGKDLYEKYIQLHLYQYLEGSKYMLNGPGMLFILDENCCIYDDFVRAVYGKIDDIGRISYNIAYYYSTEFYDDSDEEIAYINSYVEFWLTVSRIANYPKAYYMSAIAELCKWKNENWGEDYYLEEAAEYLNKALEYADDKDEEFQSRLNSLAEEIFFATFASV